MLIYDCLLDTVNDSISYDVCIIGAGIAGLILADQLSEKFNIAIIESGDFSINKRSQELNKIVISGYPVRRNHQSRVRQFGGTCNIWAGRSLILNAIDLQPTPFPVPPPVAPRPCCFDRRAENSNGPSTQRILACEISHFACSIAILFIFLKNSSE